MNIKRFSLQLSVFHGRAVPEDGFSYLNDQELIVTKENKPKVWKKLD